MMKIFDRIISVLCGTALLTACGQDVEGLKVPEYSTVPIAFDASDGDAASTRGDEFGTGWSTTNGNGMAMWAYYYESGSSTPLGMMQEQTLTYDEMNTRWYYSPIIYWPKQGEMDFFSYAPVCDGARREFTTFSPSHINHQALLVNCHVPASVITTLDQLQTLTDSPNDADNQHDLMFAFQRNVKCAEQSVTSHVNMRFAHVMAGVRLTAGGPFTMPANTAKVVFGIGRLKTGGTLALCEPATPDSETEVVWTLDGREGTFYYTATIDGGSIVFPAKEFFFPPQDIEKGLVVTAYFYDSTGHRLDYRRVDTDIKKLERGKCTVLKLTSVPTPTP